MLFEEQAKQRQLAAQNNNAAKAVRANLPEQEGTGRARDQAAALIGARLKTLFEEQAKQRQLAALKQNQSPDTVSANLREREDAGFFSGNLRSLFAF